MNKVCNIADFDDPAFDPFAADEEAFGNIAETHERLAELRDKAPVHKGGFFSVMGLLPDSVFDDTKQYTVLGYREVMEVTTDPVTYSNDAYQNSIGQTFGNTLSVMNPPTHPRYRRIFQHAFLPGIVTKWGDAIVSPVVNGIIDKFATRGYADLVNEFAILYPFQIIYRQLELPEEDIKTFHKLAVAQTLIANRLITYASEASRKLGSYFQRMIEQRRSNRSDGLVDVLVNAEVEGERLPDDVIVSFLRQLINAAGDTTYRATGTMFTGLLSNPDQYKAVCADRSLVPQTIDEALRWDGPIMMVPRTVTRDTILGGMEIPAGATLSVAIGAANHDPSMFENPNKFDIFRKRVRHCGFGHGSHVCIGQHLARLEMTRALHAIMDRLPDLRLDPDKPVPAVRGGVMRAPRSVPVRFD